MANVLLGVTGSVAAIYTRELFGDLNEAGYSVKIVATRAALYFFDPTVIAPRSAGERNRDVVIVDDDEWPGERYRRGDAVCHVELRRWADALVLAPLDAHTLAKLALGLCDNCLTCAYRAWDRSRPVVLAPAMNTLMWTHPATLRHLLQVAEDLTGRRPPADAATPEALARWLQEGPGRVRLVAPVEKELACHDVGVGAMAPRPNILAALGDLLSTAGTS
ncbi:MAG: phosphopantothenoylcysteine decarboxylase [Gemmataceae bacterium]|nr:phosphopantothenoylcysteine decarboxylase [Gemmataceae bacterium]